MTAGDILFLIFESRLPAWLNNLSTAAEDIGAEKIIFEVYLVSVLSNIANLIITASLLLNILWISTMPMDIHDIHGYDQSIHGYPYPRQACTKLKAHYDEVFLIRSNDDFNLDEFEGVMSEIQETWYFQLGDMLSKYIEQLEFIFICDNFQNELTKAQEFLSQYECAPYQEYEVMNEYKKDINNFFFSSHWYDSRQTEKNKLLDLIRKFIEESMPDDDDASSDCDLFDNGEVTIINIKTCKQLFKIIEYNFRNFNDLRQIISGYYEQGIEMSKEFLNAVTDFDENLSKKSYVLTTGYIKFEDPSKLAESVLSLRFGATDFDEYDDALVKLQNHLHELCPLYENPCQEFFGDKLIDLSSKIRDIRFGAVEACTQWFGARIW